VKGGGDSKSERKLLIVDEKSEFDQNILALDNNFKTKYGQLFEAYNEGQCAMVFDQQCDNIQSRLIFEIITIHKFQRKINSFLVIFVKNFLSFSSNLGKKIDGAKCSFILKT
jgi:hypothetical protein